MRLLRIALFGLGAIGTSILKHLLEKSHNVVAVVDTDPEKAGRTVAEITGLPSGVRIHPKLEDIQPTPEVAVFSTKSRLSDLALEIEAAIDAGMDVVTTSEEMAFPELAGKDVARRLDERAKERGVSVVGVGVNPGFVMDWVPAVIASASNSPTEIHAVRSVDVSRRRRQLQAKTGVGMTKARFEKAVSEGAIGHVGLSESAMLIARSLGRDLQDLRQGIFPVAESDAYVMGVRQYVEGRAGTCKIRLDLEMSTTSADFDVIEVKGDPPIKVRFEKGVFGDTATVALVVNAVERISGARPGLLTVLDMPLVPSA